MGADIVERGIEWNMGKPKLFNCRRMQIFAAYK